MKPGNEITHYAGFDWASDHHEVAVVDAQGIVVLQRRFAHAAEGWKELAAQLHALEAFDDWTAPATWAFLERFPTSQAVVKAGKRTWEKFLHITPPVNDFYSSPPREV